MYNGDDDAPNYGYGAYYLANQSEQTYRKRLKTNL